MLYVELSWLEHVKLYRFPYSSISCAFRQGFIPLSLCARAMLTTLSFQINFFYLFMVKKGSSLLSIQPQMSLAFIVGTDVISVTKNCDMIG